MIGILINPETGDLMVDRRTLVVGDNTEQVIECVLQAARGELKEHPLIGAEIHKLTNGTPSLMWCADTQTMLQACGVPSSEVRIEGNQIVVR